MPKKFSVLSAPLKGDPQRRERIDQQKRAIVTALALGRLRESRAITQRKLADTLDVSQANISRIEHEDDLYISTLRSYVEALGGRLQLRAVFGDEYIDIAADGLSESTMSPSDDTGDTGDTGAEIVTHAEIASVVSTGQEHGEHAG
jgi:transcriptional regulator with XRE-family HTH domain